MSREFKPIYRTKADDIYIRVDKIITPCKCIVPNCKETDCYDIQLEQPEGCSFIGGAFCKKHLECIFNFSVVESEVKVVADIDHTCHTCKHYLPGEYDGSCGSYICKNYSGWEDKEQKS